MDYIEFTFKLEGETTTLGDLLIYQLGDLGFESFDQQEKYIKAYINETIFSPTIIDNIDNSMLSNFGSYTYTWEKIESKNWNAQWEASFTPVIVNEKCIVRAPFHTIDKTYEYDIIIEPKMSFGTGHHETTKLMMQQILETEITNKSAVDCGCGTGVLAILAEKRGASTVYSFDTDQWAVENSIENYSRNNCAKITCQQGDLSLLNEKKFDIIFANINRNILIDNMNYFAASLNKKGTILFSGIYTIDIKQLEQKAHEFGLKLMHSQSINNWAVCKFCN